MNNILVDTNVLVYAIDEDSKYFSKAQKILSDPEIVLYTTSKNLSEFLSVVTRTPWKALSVPDAITAINDFSSFFHVLYPDRKSYELLLNLLKIYQPIGLQIHDFEIACIGLAHGINQIATFNEKDYNKITEIDLYVI